MTDKPYGPYKPGKRRFRMTVQTKAPPEISTNNLKRLLKRLARSFGFKVLDIRETTNGGGSDANL